MNNFNPHAIYWFTSMDFKTYTEFL